MSWEEAGIVKASEIKQNILALLLNQPQTPKDISESLDKHLSQISRNLKTLEERGLVQCMTPNLRKGRLYTITRKGQELMERLSPGEE